MKKFINFRPIFVLAIISIIFIAATINFATSTIAKFSVCVIFLVIFAIMFMLSVVFAKRVFVFLTVAALLFSVFSLNLSLKSNSLDQNLLLPSENVYVYGRIASYKRHNDNGYLFFEMDNVVISDSSGKYEIDGKVEVVTNPQNIDEDMLELGRFLTVRMCLTYCSLSGGENLSRSLSSLSDGIVASGFAPSYTFSFTDIYQRTLRDRVKSYVFDRVNSLGIEHTEIGLAMFFGEKNILDSSTKDIFSRTGTSHLLAVSGLHVTIILFLLDFILRKMKLPKWLRLLVLFLIDGFYVYLCDFSISVVRASIMIFIMLVSRAVGKDRDGLSSLSLAAILILAASPINLFDISFVMSFTAVFAILTLMPPIERALCRVLYKKVASAISLTVAIQLGLFATTIYYFGKVNVLSALINLIAVPLVSIAYVIFILSVVIFLILPFMNFLLYGYSFLMKISLYLLTVAGSVNCFLVANGVSSAVMVNSLCCGFCLSDYVMLKRKTKLLYTIIFVLIFIALFIFV